VPISPVANPANVAGRQPARAGTVKATTTAANQPAAPTPMTGHTLSSASGSGGGSGVLAGWSGISATLSLMGREPKKSQEPQAVS
jgi:hypothetical protein